MPLTVTLGPGYVWVNGELVTADKLNAAANPTINLSGTISSASVGDGSITTPKLADGVLTADATGRAKMADSFITIAKINSGIFTADGTGRNPFAANFVTATLMDESARGGVHQYVVVASGSGTAYVATLVPAATAYTAGQVVRFKADVANTAACTVNVNGLGAKSLKKQAPGGTGLVALAANDIAIGQVVEAVYNGVDFEVVSPCGGFFVSAEIAISTGLMGNVAHGLGAAPSYVRWVLRCKSGDVGFATGDELDVHCFQTAGNVTFAAGASATNVILTAADATPKVIHKTTFALTAIVTGNWRAVCYARL